MREGVAYTTFPGRGPPYWNIQWRVIAPMPRPSPEEKEDIKEYLAMMVEERVKRGIVSQIVKEYVVLWWEEWGKVG